MGRRSPTSGMIKKLKQESNARMMDCKRALEDAGCNLEHAKQLLEDRGQIGGAGENIRDWRGQH